jgi:hypothetical protein
MAFSQNYVQKKQRNATLKFVTGAAKKNKEGRMPPAGRSLAMPAII